MKKSTFLFIISGVFMLTIGSLLIIKNKNDHKECSNVIEYSAGINGEKIKTEKHICKEKWNF